MKTMLLNRKKPSTAHIQLSIDACTACWKCVEACPNEVLDKSFLYIADTLIDMHAFVYDANKCAGCLRCVQACKFDAISAVR
ncbi:hypothetical protein Palpr_2711 [Paludibacter propionicigenes WB4]|uniref:4Fe-4S ferredoxin-type domain-containing protein n=1 Tax=Paludibacter propionicigenes (strain DSM 17365 / JCM 13257 / WB4) TaxID=694427 RepID=E4T7Z7_PALPW|nr:4Fe-4S binding protein [Paludibacter propionicigenes]ADQ80841.1 hypothetical protein Palpr_2711 [Paludibacter propionicigenes WB4]